MLKVFIKHPGRLGYAAVIKDELKEMQEIVGEYIETMMFIDKMIIVLNENGRLIPLERNSIDIYGTFFVAGTEGDEFRSLTEDEMKYCYLLFNGGEE